MCWSFGVATILAITGFVLAIYMVRKKESRLLWMPLAFFAIMELLQALSYPVLGQCSLPSNQLLTVLSMIHIAFQPLAINAFLLYFIPKETRDRIINWVLGLSSLATVFLLLRLVPFDWAGVCTSTSPMCGELCTLAGKLHLVWSVPFNGIDWLGRAYTVAVFILPLIYGSWKAYLSFLVPSYLLAYVLSSTLAEIPALWCLFSVITILVALIPKMRNVMEVKKWYFWKYRI